jgi:phospholipase D1/2
VTEQGEDIYVHAKVLVVDDRLLRLGSSNLNNRSMGFDTECDVAIETPAEHGDTSAMRRAIANVRDRLLAEHLGVPQAQFAAMLAQEGHSLIAAIERLKREHSRSLRPFEPPPFSEVELEMARNRSLDPDRPEQMSGTLQQGLARPELGWALGVGLAAAVVGIAAAVGLNRRRPEQD